VTLANDLRGGTGANVGKQFVARPPHLTFSAFTSTILQPLINCALPDVRVPFFLLR
jgi:hypothetical protein